MQVNMRRSDRWRLGIVLLAVLPVLGVVSDAVSAADDSDAAAKSILQATGVRGGFIVHLGCGGGELTAALRASESYQVHGLERSGKSVAAARQHIRSRGLYGEVSVDRLRGDKLPYVDGFVNLVVAEDPSLVSKGEIQRVLAPQGVAYVRSGDGWTKTIKPRPGSIDDWTHFLHDAGGNAVAHDTVVGPPRHLQWLGSPRWSRHHDRMASLSALVSTGGRIFYVMDEGSRVSIQLPSSWKLIARDAFNGTILWKRDIPTWHNHLRPLKSGPTQLARRLVAVDDVVYVTLGFRAPLSALDAVSGETIRTFAGSQGTEEVVVTGGTVFALVNAGQSELGVYAPKHNVGDQRRVANEFVWNGRVRELMAFDVKTGARRWSKKTRVSPISLVADGGLALFHDGDKVVCLDGKTGEERWSSQPKGRRKSFTMNFGPRIVIHDRVVLFAGGDRFMHAFSLDDGKELWQAAHAKSAYQSPEDLLIVQGLVWSAPTTSSRDSGVYTGRDVRTGEVKAQFPPDVDTYWFHHRCYMAKATDRFLLPSRTGIEFVDVDKKSWEIHHWVRGGCLYGIMPCNGLIYTPPHDCACYPEAKLFGFNALAPTVSRRLFSPIAASARLEKGPAYDSPLGEPVSTEDWPTYRRDGFRSGATNVALPGELVRAWTLDLGGHASGELSSPVVADGMIFVADVNAHTVYAVDDAKGEVAWRFMAGGRVDSPPTVSRGRVYFGSLDGSVYCLRASDGALVWRFLAAPRDLRLMAFEGLESVWPVHGSVLVEKGAVHFVAGRSNFLDGGLRFFKLDAKSGRTLAEVVIDEKDPETGENVQQRLQVLNMTAGLPDVLSSDGKWIFMRSQRFDSDGNRKELGPHSGQPAEQGAIQRGEGVHLFAPMGFLDKTWFHRAYWVWGRSFAGGHAGYYQAGKFAPSGRMMVFDDENVYGFGRKAQYFRWTTTIEHQLFSASKELPEIVKPNRRGRSLTMVAIAKSPSLDPSGKSLSVEAWIKPEKPNGVVVAHGGPAQGYAVALQKRKVSFFVRAAGTLYHVRSRSAVELGQWAHVAAVLTGDKEMRVYINGKPQGKGTAKSLVVSDPVQALEIGIDDTTSVGEYKSPFGFTGTIDEVRVYHGSLSEAEIRERSAELGRAPAKSAELVLECSFDDGDGKDGSGKGNHGKATGVQVVKGRLGNGLRFVGKKNAAAGGSHVKHLWAHDVPLYVRAMTIAKDQLIVAGPADIFDEEASFAKIVEQEQSVQKTLSRQQAVLGGAEGARLWIVSKKTGERVAEHSLSAIPSWDGLAVARGRLYVTLEDGTIDCFRAAEKN